jgi:hypothetical protein
MGLGILIVGLAVFLATHVFVSFREARASVIERVGLPYTAACSRLFHSRALR